MIQVQDEVVRAQGYWQSNDVKSQVEGWAQRAEIVVPGAEWQVDPDSSGRVNCGYMSVRGSAKWAMKDDGR